MLFFQPLKPISSRKFLKLQILTTELMELMKKIIWGLKGVKNFSTPQTYFFSKIFFYYKTDIISFKKVNFYPRTGFSTPKRGFFEKMIEIINFIDRVGGISEKNHMGV